MNHWHKVILMSLATWIQNAWQKQASWLVLLRPLSWLYRGVFLWQKASKSKQAYRAKVPVMIIGNITVGGSGKTPLIIALVKYLQQQQVKVGVVSRGYGGKGRFPALVNDTSLPSQVGDEPMLIYQATRVPVAVGAKRGDVIDLLLAQHEVDLILSDDGLQHFALARDIEWVVLDTQRGLGNQKLLPEGFLREPVERLHDVSVIEHGQNPHTAYHMYLQAGQPFCLGDAERVFDYHITYQAVVGIGYPQRFLQTLNDLNIRYQPHCFADHYAYQASDLNHIFQKGEIITTSKDAVKLLERYAGQSDYLTKIWVVPVDAILSPECYQLLARQLAQCKITLQPSTSKDQL